MEFPGHLEILHVVRRDLRAGRVVVGQVGTRIGGPVAGVMIGRDVAVGAGHGAAAEGRGAVGRQLGGIGQLDIARHQQRPQDQRGAQDWQHAGHQRIAQAGQRLHATTRHPPERQQHQPQHRHHGQARHQAPAIQAHFPQRPGDGTGQRGAKQPQPGALAQREQDARQEQGNTRDQVIPGAAHGHQAAALVGEHRAKHGDHHGIGHQQPGA